MPFPVVPLIQRVEAPQVGGRARFRLNGRFETGRRAISLSPTMNRSRLREDMEHAQIDMDRRDQLRARERARQALQRGLEEDRPLPPAPREGRHPYPAEAGLSRGWRG